MRFALMFSCFIAGIFGEYTVDPENMDYVREAFTEFSGDYYTIKINDFSTKFGNRRDWKERWDIISEHIDFKGLKVLDIGCMNGLFSVFAMKYGGAEKVVGVDKQYERQYRALCKAFDVNSQFIRFNIDRDRCLEDTIGFDYDIVSCMSVMNWVRKKRRLINFLRKFDKILYEGHESLEVELSRFTRYGYKYQVLGKVYSGSWNKQVNGEQGMGRYLILFYR